MRSTTSENKKTENKADKAGHSPALSCSLANAFRKSIAIIGTAVFWLVIWYVFSKHIGKDVILPAPIAVFREQWDLMGESDFWIACGTTIIRIICGIILGCVGGIVLAGMMLVSNIARNLFYPLLSAVKATPVASFIIAALFWIDRVRVPAFISFLIVLPVICDAVYSGVRNADRGLLEVAQVYGFSLFKKLRYIWVPSAVPYFLSAIRTSVGMAWKSGVAAEVLCTPQNSIGKELNLTKVYMETADMFAWTLTIIVLSIIFEKLTVWLVGRGLSKYDVSKENYNAEA